MPALLTKDCQIRKKLHELVESSDGSTRKMPKSKFVQIRRDLLAQIRAVDEEIRNLAARADNHMAGIKPGRSDSESLSSGSTRLSSEPSTDLVEPYRSLVPRLTQKKGP